MVDAAGHKEQVLVVDDNPDIQGFIQNLLEVAGYEVSVASNGDEALGILRERGGSDVVVTDIFMPERDGLEIIQALHQQFPGTGVVAISAGRGLPGATDYLAVAKVAGAHCTLRKPFSAGALLEAVRFAATRGER